MNRALNVLQLSDLHLLENPHAALVGINTQATLEQVLELIRGIRWDAVMVTGDIAHEPALSTYSRFLATLRRFHAGPLLCLPGNHDILQQMQAAELPLADLDLHHWQIMGFDSHEDDAPAARVDLEDCERLIERLQHCPGQVLVATHHPPLPVGSPWLDADCMRCGDYLLQRLGELQQVRALVFGHAHSVVDFSRPGLAVLGAPSTCFQFTLDSPGFAVTTQPPGCRHLMLFPDGRVDSQVMSVHDPRPASLNT